MHIRYFGLKGIFNIDDGNNGTHGNRSTTMRLHFSRDQKISFHKTLNSIFNIHLRQFAFAS